MTGALVALGCSNPSDKCDGYPAANALRYIIFVIACATIMFAVMQFVAKALFGRSGQMDSRLAYLLTAYLVGSTSIFLFTEIGRLNTKPTWRIFVTTATTIIGLIIVVRMMRGDFKSDESHDLTEMTNEELHDFVQKPRHPNKTVRRRAGRR